jgi:hypothetical protein
MPREPMPQVLAKGKERVETDEAGWRGWAIGWRWRVVPLPLTQFQNLFGGFQIHQLCQVVETSTQEVQNPVSKRASGATCFVLEHQGLSVLRTHLPFRCQRSSS